MINFSFGLSNPFSDRWATVYYKDGLITKNTGAEIQVISKPDHQITIKDIFGAKAGERDKVAQIQKVSQLSEKYRNWALTLN